MSKVKIFGSLLIAGFFVFVSCTQDDQGANGEISSGYNGYGKKTFADGSYYIGEFKNGQFDGYGRKYDAARDVMSQGHWKNGLADGYLKETYGKSSRAPGAVYRGQWKEGQEHGHGYCYWGLDPQSFEHVYEGEWSNGEIHGFGVYDFADGSIYKGNFSEGERTGFGTMIWVEDGETERYDGNWRYDERNGYGVYRWNDSSVYYGNWEANIQEGRGVYFDAAGRRWEGIWYDGYCERVPDFNYDDY